MTQSDHGDCERFGAGGNAAVQKGGGSPGRGEQARGERGAHAFQLRTVWKMSRSSMSSTMIFALARTAIQRLPSCLITAPAKKAAAAAPRISVLTRFSWDDSFDDGAGE